MLSLAHFVTLQTIPAAFQRSYVALRDARVKDISAGGLRYRWSGKYQRAPQMYDTEVFISSILIAGNLDFAGHGAAIDRATGDISRMKVAFDGLGLSFEGRPLVTVIRPPLTQISYGLGIVIVEETPQARFTFNRSTAGRLRQFLLDLSARGGDYRRTIVQDTFLYAVRRDDRYMASPPVCADER